MHADFAEVLAHEARSLAAVTDVGHLDGWRHRLVAHVMAPQSAYAKALRSDGEPAARAAFLDQWHDLLATTLVRVLGPGPAAGPATDVHRTALLIVAAVHGGAVLSRLTQDAGPLSASLELALGPFLRTAGRGPGSTGSGGALGTMAS